MGFQDLLQYCTLITRQYGNGKKKKEEEEKLISGTE